jgi:hypothetical protein
VLKLGDEVVQRCRYLCSSEQWSSYETRNVAHAPAVDTLIGDRSVGAPTG